MKKILFATAIAACTFVSCKDEKAGDDKAESYKKQNAEFTQSITTGDFSKTKDWIAEDAVDHGGAPDGSDIKSRDSVIAMLSKINKCFQPGFKMNIVSQAVDGDYLFSLTEMSGTTSEHAMEMGMPPNKAMNMKSVDVIKIKDGKASEHWAYMNMADMMKMMGGGPGMPPPPPPAAMDDGEKMIKKDSAK